MAKTGWEPIKLMRLLRFAVYGLVCLALLTLVLGIYGLWVPGRSFSGQAPALTAPERELAGRLKAHITAIASVPHNTRRPAALERSAAAVEAAFRSMGYEPQKQVYESDGVSVRNIWVTIEPAGGDDVAAVVVGGHYDSAGDAPGANDNASGTAATIELARLLKGYKPARTRIYLVAFVNEESPYWGTQDQGAARFADLLLQKGERVRGMLSLETLGWFNDEPGSQTYPKPFNWIYPDIGNFVAIVGMPGSRSWLHEVIAPFRHSATVPSIGGIAPSSIPGIAWSDHAPFADRGIPALMLTDTAPFRYPHYHRTSDTPDKVDVETLARITTALDKTLRELAH
ncbi:MAG: M28 family peptidase [Hyphomicrobiaceae bacterium]|nr:M28 family peptidase [Hyphomicrobiaceae bacterium]